MVGLMCSGLLRKRSCVCLPEPQHADPRTVRDLSYQSLDSLKTGKETGPERMNGLAYSTQGE